MLDVRELDTVLAALRLWQRAEGRDRILAYARGPQWVGGSGRDALAAIAEIATEHGEPLDNAEIDALCERLNGSGLSCNLCIDGGPRTCDDCRLRDAIFGPLCESCGMSERLPNSVLCVACMAELGHGS